MFARLSCRPGSVGHLASGRRNLNPEQMSMFRGMLYNAAKKAVGAQEGNQNRIVQTRQNVGIDSTAQSLAKSHGVTPRTIERDGRFAEAVEALDMEEDVASGG